MTAFIQGFFVDFCDPLPNSAPFGFRFCLIVEIVLFFKALQAFCCCCSSACGDPDRILLSLATHVKFSIFLGFVTPRGFSRLKSPAAEHVRLAEPLLVPAGSASSSLHWHRRCYEAPLKMFLQPLFSPTFSGNLFLSSNQTHPFKQIPRVAKWIDLATLICCRRDGINWDHKKVHFFIRASRVSFKIMLLYLDGTGG